MRNPLRPKGSTFAAERSATVDMMACSDSLRGTTVLCVLCPTLSIKHQWTDHFHLIWSNRLHVDVSGAETGSDSRRWRLEVSMFRPAAAERGLANGDESWRDVVLLEGGSSNTKNYADDELSDFSARSTL